MKINELTNFAKILPLCLFLTETGFGQQGPTPVKSTTPLPPPSSTPAANRFDSSLSGDWGGERNKLYNEGMDFSLNYVSETAANPVGGLAKGIAYTQQIALGMDTDFQKLAGIPGLKAHFLFISRIGNSLSEEKIHNLFEVQEVYGGDEQPHARIVFLELEQSLFDDKLNFLAGRTNAGADFANSPLYGSFMGVSIDYHPNSLPLNGGFNVFPFSLWGGRVAVRPTDETYFKFGAYQVDPGLDYRPAFDWGTNNATGVILPFELGVTPTFGPDQLTGHYRVGGFWDTSEYAVDRIEPATSLAAISSEQPANQDGRGAVYALADQMVDRTGPGEQQGTALLGGITLSDPSTSLVDLFAFGGVVMRGYVPGRPNDYIGFLGAYGHVNHRVSDTEREKNSLGANVGVQSDETTLELDYGWQVQRWLRLTPNVQGIINPGGAGNIPDALVLGLKVDAQF